MPAAPADPLLGQQDHGRVRLLTLDRPKARNAFSEAVYDAITEAFIAAAADPTVAVLMLTGSEGAFSAGADIFEMGQRATGELPGGKHGFAGWIDQVVAFPKPFLCAVNGLAVGIGATILGLADLVVMSTEARVRCPFTALGVAPEAGSSETFTRLLGRQRATWLLLSSEWFSAEECVAMGLALKACPPDELLPETLRLAQILASKPISSLVESKRTIVEPFRQAIAAARARENDAFAVLLGGPANLEALAAFAERREPNFAGLDATPSC